MEISVTSVLYHSNPWIPLQIQDWKEISELDFEKGDSAYILSLLWRRNAKERESNSYNQNCSSLSIYCYL